MTRRSPCPLILILALLLALFLTACGSDAASLTRYQSQALAMTVSFTANGIPLRAELRLGAGATGRDATLTCLAPESLVGLTYARAGDGITAHLGEHTVPLTASPLEIVTLFEIPLSARVTDITLSSDGARRAVLSDGDTVYELCFPRGAERPSSLSRRGGALPPLSLTVEAYLPTDTDDPS